MSKLRVDKIASTEDGIPNVKGHVIYVDTVADLHALDTSGLIGGQQASVGEAGMFVWSGSEWLPKNSETITVRIPSDYPTLQEAIDTLSNFKPAQGVIIDLLIESGHQPASGIIVENGDFSHFQISSEDAEVLVDENFGRSNSFVFGNYAKMPVLNTLIDGNNGSLGPGYRAHNSSCGKVNPGCGVKNAWADGLAARYGSSVFADGSVFKSNALNGNTSSNIHALNSFINADDADATDSGYYGIQATTGGSISFYDGDVSGAFSLGMRARDNGSIAADGAKANNCGTGLRLFFNGSIQFRNGEANNCGRGVICTHTCRITMNGAKVNNSENEGILITSASIGVFNDCEVNNSRLPALQVSGSIAYGSNFRSDSCETIAIDIERSSSVYLESAVITNSDSSGIRVIASNLDFENGESSGHAVTGLDVRGASNVNAKGSTIKNNSDGVRVSEGSTVCLDGADCQSNEDRGIYAFRGGKVSAYQTLCERTPGSPSAGNLVGDIVLLQGAIVFAHDATGAVNSGVGINEITERGTVYRDV